MKKSLLALAVLGAFTGVASAQSSVTLFGVVDQAVTYQKSNGKRIISLDSNQMNSNRLGFKGIEDLGGGLQAGFWLEMGMQNDTGAAGGSNGLTGPTVAGASPAPNSLFNRRSTVSLISKLGEIRIGRDYTPTFWNTVLYDVYGANGFGEGDDLVNFGMNSGAVATSRANNSVAYWLPSAAGGFYGRAMVAGSEGVSGAKYYGGSLNWAGAGADVGVGYGATKFKGAAIAGTTANNGSPDLKIWNVGASYDFGVAKIYALYNVNKFDPAQQKTFELSAGIPFGASAINASFTTMKYSGAALTGLTAGLVGKAQQYSAQYVYNLSKRTAMYAGASHITNKDGASFGFGNDTGIAGLAVPVNGKVNAADIGVRHSF
jgi:predicted porin